MSYYSYIIFKLRMDMNIMEMNLSKSGGQWTIEEPGILQSMGLQRIGHDLVTEQQQQSCVYYILFIAIVYVYNQHVTG